MKKIVKISIIMLLLIMLTIPIKAEIETDELTSEEYTISNEYISKVMPETDIKEFKEKLNTTDIKIYEDKDLTKEVTQGNIKTNMYLKYNNEVRSISVMGDLNGDGLANQIDLSLLIRYIKGTKEINSKTEKQSADFNGDLAINKQDINSLIHYIVYGKLDSKDPLEPEIINIEVEQTTNSVNLIVETSNMEGGTYEYFYKEETQDEFVKIEKTKSNKYNLTWLQQNTTYDIKVKVTNTYNKTSEKQIKITTWNLNQIESENIIQDGPIIWEDGLATLNLKTQTTHKIQWQKNTTEGRWTVGTTITNLDHNDVVYARLWDGMNTSQIQSFKIEDTTNPTLILTKGEVTTCSIKISAKATDNESGMPEISKYRYYIKHTNEDNYPLEPNLETQSNICLFTNLIQGTSYDIKVEISDRVGNKQTEQINNIVTGEVKKADGNIKINAPIWNPATHKAKVIIQNENEENEFEIQYQINGYEENKWITSNIIENLNLNDTVYARLWDGTNGGAYISEKIVDTQKPLLTLDITATTNSITVNAVATDNEIGMIENPIYNFYIKKGNEEYKQEQSGTNSICAFTSLIQNTEYTVKVTTQDMAGNETIETRTVMTGRVISAEGGNISISSPIWNQTKHSASVTLSKANTVDNNFEIQYQINGYEENKWQMGIIVSNLNLNDTIYARLWDGINGGDYISLKIIDTTNPVASIIAPDTAYVNQVIDITVEQTDNFEIAIENCKYEFNTSDEELGTEESLYTGTFTSTNEVINVKGTTAGSYYLHILTTDIAGNKIETITDEIVVEGTYSYSKTLGYSGGIQTFTIQETGVYKLEVWGARGGSGSRGGGSGGYAVGYKFFEKGENLYICCGGAGADSGYGGGYNGGGAPHEATGGTGGTGGGCTHIAWKNNRGTLANYTNNRNEVLIVAGGGGAGGRYGSDRKEYGAAGGGESGTNANNGAGGTQTSGAGFGTGGSGSGAGSSGAAGGGRRRLVWWIRWRT